MPSFRTAFVAVATALVATVHADYEIEPSSVTLTTRKGWCSSEISTCPLICQQTSTGAEENTCDPQTLDYTCLCSDGRTPNVSQYSLTLPYFICQEWGNQCVDDCGDNNTCASSCREDHPCGAQSPNITNTTTSASSSAGASSTSSSADTVYTSLGGESSGTRRANLEATRVFTTMGMLGGFFLGFAVLL